MPQIEADYVPVAEPQGLRFLPVLSDSPSDRGTFLLIDNDVSTATIIDPEGEMFRKLRVAGAVFPLNVIIDRDGIVKHVDNELEYGEAAAAADAEL